MIYTYCNFRSTFLQLSTWWYIWTATLYQFFRRRRRDDIYIPQLYINSSADKTLMIYRYPNFISIFLQMNTLGYFHTATFYQLFFIWTRADIYIPELYIIFPAHEHLIIYIHSETLYELFSRWTRGNIYMVQLYIKFSADEQVIIYTYPNFISTFLQMRTL